MKKKRKCSANYGRCPKCGEVELLTRHHFLPRRYFGENPFIIKICQKCHDEVELLIPEYRLSACDYFEIAYCFIYRQTYIRR